MPINTPTPTRGHRAFTAPLERNTTKDGLWWTGRAIDRASPRLDRLDVQSALILHLEWCVLFNEHLSASATGNRMTSELADVEHCGLGQWIGRAQSQATEQHPMFAELELEHHQLHAVAVEAISLAREGRMDLVKTVVNIDFERSRARILEMLRSLQRG
jgi:hypothetical protein